MTEEKTAPENQESAETGGESLILGKYKTQEEAFAALEQAEKEKNDLREALDREQKLNQLLDSVPNEPEVRSEPAASSYTPLNQVFEEEQAQAFNSALDAREQQIWRRVDEAMERKIQAQEAKRHATDTFYKKYPELTGFETEVEHHAMNLGQELGKKAAQVPFDKLAEEIASRTKKQLADTKRKLTKTSLHIEAGGMSEPKIPSKEKDAGETSEEERTQKYFETEVKAFNEKKNLPFRGGAN